MFLQITSCTWGCCCRLGGFFLGSKTSGSAVTSREVAHVFATLCLMQITNRTWGCPCRLGGSSGLENGSGGALGCSGVLWTALWLLWGCSGLLWAALGCSGLLWAALGCSRSDWGCSGAALVITYYTTLHITLQCSTLYITLHHIT